MFLDHMIRPAEVEHFSSTLQPHQLARLPPVQPIVEAPEQEEEEEEVMVNSNNDKKGPAPGKQGPETVLDRAMMEHNVLACSRVYNNITFRGLGIVLGLRPSAAEAMARTMIQQKRLYATIDQIDKVIVFDVEDKEGGDGIVSNVAQQQQPAADEGGAGGQQAAKKEEAAHAPATKRWDMQIRQTLQLAESVAARCEVLLARQVDTTGRAGGQDGKATTTVSATA